MANYKKLSRQHRSGTGYSRLWLGEDHLLLVTSSGYSEEYRRFFFSDIQALIVRKTKIFAIVNWIFLPLAVLMGALGLIFSDAAAFHFVIAGICVAVAGLNAALGPSCLVHVQTAIATHPLEPLHRLRPARKVLDRLVPLIRAAQGELSPEQLAQVTAPAAAAVPPRTS